MFRIDIARRQFLRGLVAVGALPLARIAAATREAAAPSTSSSVRTRLRGPILSIPTPFTADYRVDNAAIQEMVRRALAAGIRIFSLTAGNGQYSSLDTPEIKELTRVLVEAVDGKGFIIAAAANWWTGQVVEYSKFASSLRVDALQVMRPEGVDEDAVVAHFERIAGASSLPIVLHGDYSSKLLERLVKLPTVSALKEDVTLDYYIDRQRHFGDRLVIFGGGTEHRFHVAHPYGSNCYYSAYTAFSPETSMDFWRMVQQKDIDGAYAWVNRFDFPFLDRWSHAFWRASMEHFGVGRRFLRPPQPYFTDAQMKDVKTFYDGLGLTPPASDHASP
jgi:dihydrodipicolinate synthase/N-acetylneuraminate lyase